MSCPVCTHDGAIRLGEEVKYLLWPWGWFQKIVTGVILGCTRCSKTRVERKDGVIFLLNHMKAATPQSNGDKAPRRTLAHDRDMQWDRPGEE